MTVKRFTARSSREALMAVRQAFGDDAVVVSTRPCPQGVEVLAMAPDSVQQFERIASAAAAPAAPVPARRAVSSANPPTPPTPAPPAIGAATPSSVDSDVEMLGMSTLSFQDYVRERMLKRRQAELDAPRAERAAVPIDAVPSAPAPTPSRTAAAAPSIADWADEAAALEAPASATVRRARGLSTDVSHDARSSDASSGRRPEPARAATPIEWPAAGVADGAAAARRDQATMLDELRSMRGLIEQRFGALAFMEKLQRQPRQALLSQKLLDAGLSPQLVRKLVEALPDDGGDPMAWATEVLQRHLFTGDGAPALEDQGGVYALVGSTGVGKTTSTAKLAAAFATRHGASALGLVTLDAYRVGAHEQLRAYGRILGVPVHTAHDRASLEDLLDLLAGKKMVLIDTAGMAQRDTRTRELLEMLSHRSIHKLLVVNAAQQGETIEDVLISYRAAACKGIVLSKIDEAVKLGPALDALIRHRAPVLAVANGQRVPEDWHRLSALALVQRALRGGGSPAWRHDSGDVGLVFAGAPAERATPGALRELPDLSALPAMGSGSTAAASPRLA